jgi:aminobenzoyl-glutamate utilization protein B
LTIGIHQSRSITNRQTDYPHIKELREVADRIGQAAATMTDTKMTSRVLGAAWPQHFNKPKAEAWISPRPG